MTSMTTHEDSKAVTYASYLKVDELLALQQLKSDPAEHDELLFITIHQVYELWFKIILHELDQLKIDLSRGALHESLPRLRRVNTVLKTLVGQIDILETMTPLSFASFRERLDSASGFQSAQFREVEFVLGYKRPDMIDLHPSDQEGHARLMTRLEEPSVVDAFYDFLETRGVDIPQELRSKAPEAPNVPNEAIQDAIVEMYRTQPDVILLLELMTDLDEGLQEWRYRHVKMVERTLGHKIGTGGSSGAEFLRRSLFNPVFPDLWAVRSRF
ncbi:MAG: tryptophan 2,3-dioxygenase [Acidimicrobiia bacterium]